MKIHFFNWMGTETEFIPILVCVCLKPRQFTVNSKVNICPDRDLEPAVELISDDEFEEKGSQWVVGAGRVQRKHVKVPPVDILKRDERMKVIMLLKLFNLMDWNVAIPYIQSLLWHSIDSTNTECRLRFMLTIAHPETVYDSYGLVRHGCCVGPLEHPEIMECLCWVQLKFKLTLCSELVPGPMYINPLKPTLSRLGRMFYSGKEANVLHYGVLIHWQSIVWLWW